MNPPSLSNRNLIRQVVKFMLPQLETLQMVFPPMKALLSLRDSGSVRDSNFLRITVKFCFRIRLVSNL